MNRKTIAIVLLSAAVGMGVGILIADWRFTKDPDVVLAARFFLGGVGAMIGGFGAKWLFLRQETVE